MSHRRLDGHLGRFDPTVSPQYLSEKVWRGFILRPTIGFAKPAMVKRAELLAAAIDARARLQNSYTNYWDTRPTLPSLDQVRSLGECPTYEEAVDLCTEVQRGMKEQSAWLEFVERLHENWATAKARLKVEGVLPANEGFIGAWINGNRGDDALWLMSQGVPCFMVRELEPLDEWVWTTSRDTRESWVAGTEAELLRTTEYDEIALSNGSAIAPFVAPRPHPAVPSLGGKEFVAAPLAFGWVADQTGFTVRRVPSAARQEPIREATPVADPDEWPPVQPTLLAPEPRVERLYEGRVAWIKPPPVYSTRNQTGNWTKFLDDGDGHFVKISSAKDLDSDDEGHAVYDRHLRRELYSEQKIPALPGLVSNTGVYGWPAPRGSYWEKVGSQGKVKQVASSSWVYGSAFPGKGIVPLREPTPPPADKLPLLGAVTPVALTETAMLQGSSPLLDTEMQSPPRVTTDQDAVMASPPKPLRPPPRRYSSESVKLSWGSDDDYDEPWVAGAPTAASLPLAKAYLRSGDFAPNVPWTEMRDALFDIAKGHPEIHIVDCVQSSTMYRQTVWVSLTNQEGADLLRTTFQRLSAPPRGATELVSVEAEEFIQAQLAAGTSTTTTTASRSPTPVAAAATPSRPSPASSVRRRSLSSVRRRSLSSVRRRSLSSVRRGSPPRPARPSPSPPRRRRSPDRRVTPAYRPRRRGYSPPAERMSSLPGWEARSRRGPSSRERSPRRTFRLSPRRRSPTPPRWGRGRSRSPRRYPSRSPASYDSGYSRREPRVRLSRSRSARSYSSGPHRAPSTSGAPVSLPAPVPVPSFSAETLADLARLTTALLAQYGQSVPTGSVEPASGSALVDRLTHPPPPLDARLSHPLPLAERLLAAPFSVPAPAPPPLIRRMQVTLGERVGDTVAGPSAVGTTFGGPPAPPVNPPRRQRANQRRRIARLKREGLWDYSRAADSGDQGGDDGGAGHAG
ncbi:hypothetical protein FPV67DRAFT_1679991 [Lyophyllum atratum]|nr:hypothetical protein FPV67DRAFT_1679991 [Lyophyllum atratum]